MTPCRLQRQGFVRRALCAEVAALHLLVTTGCGAGWQRPDYLAPGPVAPRQQVRIWSGPEVSRWHAVVVTTDSLSGIPWLQPIGCDACRIAVPRAHVDSVQFGNPTAGFWKSVGLGVGLVLGVFLAVCSRGCLSRT